MVSPGFPIYSGSTGPDGRDVALVASLGPSPSSSQAMSRDDIKAAVIEALREQEFHTAMSAAMARAAKLGPPRSPREIIGARLAEAGL